MTSDERLAILEDAVANLASLVQHMGQTLSWSSCGQQLNNPPNEVKQIQKQIEVWHKVVAGHRRDAQAEVYFERMIEDRPLTTEGESVLLDLINPSKY